MRSEEEVRELYKNYVKRYALAKFEKKEIAAHQYYGAAIACGRTLGKDMKRINLDLSITFDYILRESNRG